MPTRSWSLAPLQLCERVEADAVVGWVSVPGLCVGANHHAGLVSVPWTGHVDRTKAVLTGHPQMPRWHFPAVVHPRL